MNAYTSFCPLSWSVSRGRDTAGWNICRLDSPSGARYRTRGGGYDMTGTVVADLIEAEYQPQLRALVAARAGELVECGYGVPGYRRLPGMHGLTVRPDGSVSLDGAYGLSSIEQVAKAAGVRVTQSWNKRLNRGRGACDGFFIGLEG